jgi:hypothetical protein
MTCRNCTSPADRAGTVSLYLLDLAAEFVVDVAGERGAWPELLRRWGVARGLADEVIDQLRRVLIRERVARAASRHRGRQ